MSHEPHHPPTTFPRPASDLAGKSDSSYGALSEFLRGYFHQDLEDAYGSPAQAVARFCADADAALSSDAFCAWQQLLSQHGADLAALNQQLHQLGSSWNFTSPGEVEAVSSAFHKSLPTR